MSKSARTLGWLVVALSFCGVAVAQPVTPPTLLNQSINLGTGKITAAAVNGWAPTIVLQDPNASTFSTGTGYANGDVLTLNDGCATHAQVTVQQQTSGVVTQILRTVPGSCSVAPSNPVGVLSTTGTGTGATFNLVYAPQTALLYAATGSAGDLFITDVTSPQPGLYGTEDTFLGHGAGGAFTGASSFDTAVGLNDFGIGGGAPSVGGSNTGVGTDCARNITSTGGVNGIDCFGAGALKYLGTTPSYVAGGISGISALGNGALANVTALNGTSFTVGVGTGTCSGSSIGTSGGSVFIDQSLCVGANLAPNFTGLANALLVGTRIAQTVVNESDLILVGDGATTVEPPTSTTSHYLNFNNLWTATGINAPASSSQVFYGDVTSGGGTSALATTATTGFDHVPSMAGSPSGAPVVTSAPAVVINSTSHSINVYIGGSWYHVALTSGAG